MIMSIKLEDSSYTVCRGCLSSSRLLLLITDSDSYIYNQLLGIEMYQENDHKWFQVKMCWECRGLLRKIRSFQLQIRKAHSMLMNNLEIVNSNNLESLSTLATQTLVDAKFETEDSLIEYNDITEISCMLKDDDDKNIDQAIKTNETEDVKATKNNFNDGSLIEYNDITEISRILKDDNDDNIDEAIKTDDNDSDDDNNDIKQDLDENFDVSTFNNKIDQQNVEVQKPKINENRKRNYNATKENTSDIAIDNVKNKRKAGKRRRIMPFINHKKHYTDITLTKAEVLEIESKKKGRRKGRSAKLYPCNECVLSFDTENEIDLHYSEVHNRKRGAHDCDICHKHFQTKTDLISHNRKHYAAVKCNYCDYKTHLLSVQRDHYKRCHYSGRIECDKCDQIFHNLKEYKKHKSEHNAYICDICGKKAYVKDLLIDHIRKNHSIYKCSICGVQKGIYKRLKQHMAAHHDVYSNKKIDVDKDNCYCVECDKYYPTLYKYRLHLNTSVKHTAAKKITVPCPECGKIFTKTTYMRNHYNLYHLKKTKHHCNDCDKYFANGFGLRKHIEFVHKLIKLPKTKICQECGMAFSSSGTLKRHMLTHTGERPHQCPHCPSRFGQKSAMTTHIKHIHNKQRLGIEK